MAFCKFIVAMLALGDHSSVNHLLNHVGAVFLILDLLS